MIPRLTLIAACLLIPYLSNAQWNCEDSLTYRNVYMKRTHNGFGFIPAKARVTNGLAMGWLISVDDYCNHMDSVRINGLHLNASPFAAIAGCMAMMFTLYQPQKFREQLDIKQLRQPLAIHHKLNGLSISFVEGGKNWSFQGAHITVIARFVERQNGLSVSGMWAEHKYFNGLAVSGILNLAEKANGVQIALFNHAHEMRGVQLGLWNRIGRRATPLINANFRRNG